MGCTRFFLAVASSHVDFEVQLPLKKHDFDVIRDDAERAALLQAALHHPFQLKETRLTAAQQRHYFDKILHAPVEEAALFLTEKDFGAANGAISNMLKITSGKSTVVLRKGRWFECQN